MITLVRCWTVVCLLLGDAADEVRMIAVSSTTSAVWEQLADPCISDDDVVALVDALKLKISSSLFATGYVPFRGDVKYLYCAFFVCASLGNYR